MVVLSVKRLRKGTLIDDEDFLAKVPTISASAPTRRGRTLTRDELSGSSIRSGTKLFIKYRKQGAPDWPRREAQ